MITVATVLTSGGPYHPGHVYRLKRMLDRHLPEHEFVCLTDMHGVPSPWRRELEHGWPKWWAKMECFRPGLFTGPVLYLDLDSDVVGSLADLASYYGPLALLTDFNNPERAQTGVMAFSPSPEIDELWAAWIAEPEGWMQTYESQGAWMHAACPSAQRLQELFPKQIVSFKTDCCTYEPGVPMDIGRRFRGIPAGARIVCYHGTDKPMISPRPALILGAAACLRQDLAMLEELAPIGLFEVFAANDGGVAYTGHIDHWVTVHPDELPQRRARRRKSGGDEDYLTWAISGAVDRILPHDYDVGEWTSVGRASCVARYLVPGRPIVWAGAPMDNMAYAVPHLHHGEAAWPHWRTYQEGVPSKAKQHPWIRSYIRSMSGWTAKFFGEPDAAFLGLETE